jgi:protein N-terminal methyltransferase
VCAQEEFRDPDALWAKARDADGSHSGWYQGAVAYWDAQEASYDGVLGGFGHVSSTDIADSSALLQRVSVVWMLMGG